MQYVYWYYIAEGLNWLQQYGFNWGGGGDVACSIPCGEHTPRRRRTPMLIVTVGRGGNLAAAIHIYLPFFFLAGGQPAEEASNSWT